MPQFIKLPDPIHAQLKALAAARSTTMVEVIASFTRQAVEAGEIKPEASGFSVSLLLDLDAATERDAGPYVVIKTPAGDMPPMTREDAETVAGFLGNENGTADTITGHRTNRTGRWSVERRGTLIKLSGTPAGRGAKPIIVTLAPIIARDLAGQVWKAAQSATPDRD